MDYKCLYCNSDLIYWDYFGRICNHQDGYIEGDIYKCSNEECNETFHVHRNNDELHEGMPC